MQSHNLDVYASNTGFKSELVGTLTAERYQQIRKNVWLNWRLYFGAVYSIFSGIYRVLNSALNSTPSVLFAVVVICAFFNSESGLTHALSAGIQNPALLVDSFVTLVKLSFGLALLFVFLRDVFMGASSLSMTYNEAVNKAVAMELGVAKDMQIDLIGEPISRFVSRAADGLVRATQE